MAARFAPSAYGHSVGDARPYDPPRYERVKHGGITVLRTVLQPPRCSRCHEVTAEALAMPCRGYPTATATRATHAAVQREIAADREAERETVLLRRDGSVSLVEAVLVSNVAPRLPAPPKVAETLQPEPLSPQQRRKVNVWRLRRAAPPQREPQSVEWQPFRADAAVEAELAAANAALHARGAR